MDFILQLSTRHNEQSGGSSCKLKQHWKEVTQSCLSPLLFVLELAFELNEELLDPAEPALNPRFLWTVK